MEAFFDSLKNPAWWLSVIFAGIVVNLVAAYLKPKIDHMGASVSRSWANRTEKRRMERESRIEELRSNSELRSSAYFLELRYRVKGLWSFAFASVFLIGSLLVSAEGTTQSHVFGRILTIAALIAGIFSFNEQRAADGIATELRDAI